jgi:hypothetical protein
LQPGLGDADSARSAHGSVPGGAPSLQAAADMRAEPTEERLMAEMDLEKRGAIVAA